MRAGAGQIQHSCVCVHLIYMNTDAIVTCVDVGVVCVVFWWPVLTLNNIVFEMETNTNNIFAFEINNMMTAVNRNIKFSIRRCMDKHDNNCTTIHKCVQLFCDRVAFALDATARTDSTLQSDIKLNSNNQLSTQNIPWVESFAHKLLSCGTQTECPTCTITRREHERAALGFIESRLHFVRQYCQPTNGGRSTLLPE